MGSRAALLRRSGVALVAALMVALSAPGCPGDDPPRLRCVDLPRPPSLDKIALERVFPGVSIPGGVDLVQPPGDDSRWFLATQGGQVVAFDASDDAAASVVLDLSDAVVVDGEAGLLGIAFHPDFASNGELFVSYNAPGGGGAFLSRVSRFTSVDDGEAIDRASEAIILEVEQPYTNHNGGDLGFGPDGLLYFGLGDGGSAGDPQGNGQDVDTLLGAMLRIDVDGGSPYAIPPDNPFAEGGGRPELFAWGLRNPWRWSFDRETGDLWVGDVGQHVWEEVNRVVLGGNYGWNVKEGAECYAADSCAEDGLIDPVAAYRNTSAASVIGGVVYRGAALPELVGRFIYSDFYLGTIWSVDAAGSVTVLSEGEGRGITAYGQDQAGEVYAVHYDGGIYRLRPRPADEGPGLPARLSETGCVDPAAPTTPPAGLVEYEVNVPFWSDGATKSRWLAIPAGKAIAVEDDGDLTLPPGSTLVKSFHVGEALVETRLLVRHDDGGWAGYSYRWDPEGGDAELLEAADERALEGQTWGFPARGECLFCHTDAAGRSLGIELGQLDRTIVDADGQAVDQLDRWVELGWLAARPSATPLPAAPSDPLEARARAYLHANCSHCHRPMAPGGRSAIDLRYATPLADVGICDAAPRSGDLGIADARLLAPGDPQRSLILARMRSLSSTRMPEIGSAVVDEEGAALVEAWIASLSACP
ncbi:MAG: PQQ-dependent sugar dehydrogenase [Myxococcales bacterium]|nr:PQQ-dependent sugar dehydrogenase [Myxococcales bacterium]